MTGVQALPQPGQATSSPASSSLTPSSLASGDLDLNLADLELLHHYMTETCATLADQSPALRGFFRDAAVQMGLRDSYVMRMVLAISALHLTHLRGGDVYRARAAAHHRVASQAAVAAMTADVTSQTAPSLFVFAIMTTIYGKCTCPLAKMRVTSRRRRASPPSDPSGPPILVPISRDRPTLDQRRHTHG